MFSRLVFVAPIVLWSAIGLAGCAGGGASAPAPAVAGGEPAQSVEVHVSATSAAATIPLTAESSGSIYLHSADPGVTVRLGTAAPGGGARETASANHPCPSVPPIVLFNPASHAITVALDRFTVKLPCSVDGLLFGASTYQSYPVPATVVSTKLGDAKGMGKTITFTPVVSQLTLPAKTAIVISILPESSTAFTALPAIAGAAAVLTSNAPAVPNSLSLEPPNVAGGTTFQSACFLPNDAAGPGLAGVKLLGTPTFYCLLAPGQPGKTTTFGGANSTDIVKFKLGPNVKPDASFVSLDGAPIYVPCTPATGGEECDSPPFAIPAYTKAIVSNVADVAVCAPAVDKTDCNGVAGPKAPSATAIIQGHEFPLLFADDPTYNAANSFGGVTLRISDPHSPCVIDVGPDAGRDAPPHYTDPPAPAGSTPWRADFTGTGPNVEFDLKAKSPGTCVVSVTEDTGPKRTVVFKIAVKAAW